MIIAGGSAYPRQIDFARFRAIADAVGAILWSTWPILPGSSPAAPIPTRSRMLMWRRRRPTRPCAARAAA
jgi:hypothetical protein